MPSSSVEHRRRLDALAKEMVERDLDLVLLFDRDNVQYFTDFQMNRAANSILAVGRDGSATYIVARLDLKRAERDCWIQDVIAFPEDTPDYLSVLKEMLDHPSRRVGVETDTVTLRQAEDLKKLAGEGLELVDVSETTQKLRVIKSPEEIAYLRQTARIADDVMEQIRREIRPGAIEAELVGKTEYLIRQASPEGPSFEPFMMSGQDAWLPRRVVSAKPLGEGDLVLLDMGVLYGGYCSDLTRTFVVGEPSDAQRRLFQVARKAQQAAAEAIRPGVTAGEVDAAARQVIEAEGWGQFFPHLTGHGVGLSIHEPPIVDKGAEMVLRPGMVTTVEPGIYLPGVGAARVEDMVLVTPSGHEMLTTANRNLI